MVPVLTTKSEVKSRTICANEQNFSVLADQHVYFLINYRNKTECSLFMTRSYFCRISKNAVLTFGYDCICPNRSRLMLAATFSQVHLCAWVGKMFRQCVLHVKINAICQRVPFMMWCKIMLSLNLNIQTSLIAVFQSLKNVWEHKNAYTRNNCHPQTIL